MSSPILTQIFELEEWHHPNVVDDDNRPSGPEAFQQLAPVLATGNLRGLHLIATSRSTANAAPGFVNRCTGNVAAECSPLGYKTLAGSRYHSGQAGAPEDAENLTWQVTHSPWRVPTCANVQAAATPPASPGDYEAMARRRFQNPKPFKEGRSGGCASGIQTRQATENVIA